MKAVYELIGRLVVTAVRQRYSRELRTAAVAGAAIAALAAVGVYAATRDSDQDQV